MYLYKMYAVVCTTTRVCYPRALSLSRSTQVLHVFLNVDRLWRRVGRFVFFFFFQFFCTNDPLDRRFNTMYYGRSRSRVRFSGIRFSKTELTVRAFTRPSHKRVFLAVRRGEANEHPRRFRPADSSKSGVRFFSREQEPSMPKRRRS